MRAFIVAMLAIAAIAVWGNYALEQAPFSSADSRSSDAVRLDE